MIFPLHSPPPGVVLPVFFPGLLSYFEIFKTNRISSILTILFTIISFDIIFFRC